MAENLFGSDRFSGGIVTFYRAQLFRMPKDHAHIFVSKGRTDPSHTNPFLDTVVNLLRQGQFCTIAGTTSFEGTDDVNEKVGKKRAQAVKDFLVRRVPAARDRIKIVKTIIQKEGDGSTQTQSRGAAIRVTSHQIPD